ncbi:MAG: hypothetical protein K8T10_04995 [Candidatus Eremiobacteraeota bacterium]|nr:hypothetical protein [Candidatus Eremiobacteraeota bacterium]
MKTCRIALMTIIAIVLLTTIIPGHARGDDTWIIKPGVSVGWVQFGITSIKDVVKQFGNLDGRSKDKTTILYRKRYGMDITYDKNTLKVTSVMIMRGTSKGVKYVTDRKLYVGAPMASAMKVYKQPTLTINKKPYKILTYLKKDRFLSFVGKEGKIVMIWTGLKSAYDEKISEVKESLQ